MTRSPPAACASWCAGRRTTWRCASTRPPRRSAGSRSSSPSRSTGSRSSTKPKAARPRWPPPTSSITLDGGGALSAVSAGESDKTHEFLEAAAAVAVSAAKPAVAPADPEAPCRRFSQQDPRFQRYLDRHRDLAAQLANARAALEARRRAVDGGTGTAKLRTIASLADLAGDLETQLAADRFELDEDQFNIAVGEKVVQPRKANATPWVEVVLTEEGSP